VASAPGPARKIRVLVPRRTADGLWSRRDLFLIIWRDALYIYVCMSVCVWLHSKSTMLTTVYGSFPIDPTRTGESRMGFSFVIRGGISTENYHCLGGLSIENYQLFSCEP
jgi:hypothetical protein